MMLDIVIMRSVQTFEHIRMNGWSSLLRETIYYDRKAVIFEKNLLETKDRESVLKRRGVRVIEITPHQIQGQKYRYRVKNRYYKALHYNAKGYAGYAIMKGNEIIGDIWYSANNPDQGKKPHPDTEWLGITLENNHVYAFDMFLIPGERGNNVAALFQSQALYLLGKQGYVKAFAYVWADNIPAIWNARFINKWNEIRTARMNRFLIGKIN